MFLDKLKNYHIILASGSPRRRELLKGLDIPFDIAPAYHVDETYSSAMPVREVPRYLAELKSDLYPYQLLDKDLLITADTLVLCDDQLLGKPTDRSSAIAMLTKLSGKKHEVITAVCLRQGTKKQLFEVSSFVSFQQLEQDDIAYYVDHYKPFDKAGAYGVQEWIGYIGIQSIEGSYYNIMGLPVQRLYQELKEIL